MSAKTLLLYLLFERGAIDAIAVDPSALWAGLALTLSAGLARSYATHDLRRQPWRLLLPPVAALLMAGCLFLGVLAKLGRDVPPGAFRSLAGLVLCTAPLAWLYGLPFDHLFAPAVALSARLITLAVVAIWRVALLIVALGSLLDGRFLTAAFLVLFVADIIMLLGLFASGRWSREKSQTPTLIGVMAGLTARAPPRSAAANLLGNINGLLLVGGLIGVPIGLWMLESKATANRWTEVLASPIAVMRNDGVWILAGGMAIVFAILLPWGQRRPRLRSDLEVLFRLGCYHQAIRRMNAHPRSDLSPEWSPPPEDEFRNPPRLLDVMEAVASEPATGWVREEYLTRFRAYLADPLWYWYDDADLPQLARLLEQLAEGPELARIVLGAIKEWDQMRESDFAAFLPTLLELEGKEPSPERNAALATIERIAAMESP